MKKLSVILAILLVILFLPIPKGTLNDGGTRVYTSLTYTVVAWNRILADAQTQEVSIYSHTSVYFFPDNLKTIDELWDMEYKGISKAPCEGTGGESTEALNADTCGETTEPLPAERRMLTLDDVLTLSEKGETLSWEDFHPFIGRDVGSGLYIMAYEIDGDFRVLVGGVPTVAPYYIRLEIKDIDDAYIDIRYDDVKAFITEHS